MPIEKDQVVSFAYTLKDDEGNLIDEGTKDQPLTYLHGNNNLIPGMEEAIAGKEVGDSFETVIPPEKGYGVRDPELDLSLTMDQFPEEHREHLAPGVQFQGPHPKNETEAMVYTIHDVEGEKVLVSGNHALAGMNLNFAIEIVEVREATADELEHGHVHGPSCDH